MNSSNKLMQLIHHVDLSRHPRTHIPPQLLTAFNSRSTKENWATLGDLHANPLKLIYFMVCMGAASISEEDYAAFAAMLKGRVDAAAVLDFSKLKIAQGALLRLIGDEMADRWLCGDDDVMKTTNTFKLGGGILEILLSNHTACFIQAIEIALHYANASGVFDEKIFLQHFQSKENWSMQGEFVASLQATVDKLNAGTLSVKRLIELYNVHKTSFKAFSYDYAENGELIVYSHASISRFNIYLIAAEMYDYMTDQEKLLANQIAGRAPDIDTNDLEKSLLQYKNTPLLSDNDIISLIDIINRVVATATEDNRLTTLFRFQNRSSELFNCIQNRDDPHDNTLHNVHGHEKTAYGLRETLDNLLGHRMLSEGEKRAVAQLPEGDDKNYFALSFTKTWPIPLHQRQRHTDAPLCLSTSRSRENIAPSPSRWNRFTGLFKCCFG